MSQPSISALRAARVADGDRHATDGVLSLREGIYITPSGTLVNYDGKALR